MRELGVDPKIVADSMGHDLDVNLNTYTQTPLDDWAKGDQTTKAAPFRRGFWKKSDV